MSQDVPPAMSPVQEAICKEAVRQGFQPFEWRSTQPCTVWIDTGARNNAGEPLVMAVSVGWEADASFIAEKIRQMARDTGVYLRTYVIRGGKLVEKSKALRPDGPFFMRDIEEYASPITGEPITSRSHRREEMARHGCVDRRDLKGELLANGKRHRG